jgi:hypothetical protein
MHRKRGFFGSSFFVFDVKFQAKNMANKGHKGDFS